MAAGKTWLSSAVAESIVEGTVREGRQHALSPREEEVLSLMAKGLGNEAIAETLSISLGTVKNHVSNLYSKLGVRSRAEAVAWAWAHRKQED
ncbi:MAG: response regulator transcription factor [Anaerolineales bacterium]